MLVNKRRFVRYANLVVHAMTKGNKLVTTDAPKHIIRSNRRAQDVRKAHQHFVAHRMTINIINRLEAVKINHQKCAMSLRTDFLKFLFRRRFIQKSGQGVGARMLLQPLDLFHRLQYIANTP